MRWVAWTWARSEASVIAATTTLEASVKVSGLEQEALRFGLRLGRLVARRVPPQTSSE